MKKFNINWKNIRRIFACIGVGGVLVAGSLKSGLYINPKTCLPDFYYINTKSVNMTNAQLLAAFQNSYNNLPELQKEWNVIYPEVCEFISDYGEYLDQEELIDTIDTLKIERVDKIHDGTVLALFDYPTNTIKYSDNLFKKSDSDIKEIKLHEAFHYLFHQNFFGSGINFSHRGLQLDEGLVSLLVREYGAYSNVDIYEKNSYYVRALCELIGTDEYMKAAGKHNLSALIESLNEYSKDNEGKKLLSYIDKACLYYDSYGTDNDKNAWAIIEKMYFEKNGISIKDNTDIVMKAYSNKLAKTSYEITGARGYSNVFVEKNYFKNIDNPTISYKNFGKEYGSADLNQNNEIISGKVLTEGVFDENGDIVDKDGNKLSVVDYIDLGEKNKSR